MARMRRACLRAAGRAASARNCEILKPWGVISTADMLPAPRINDMLHRVTFAAVWESPRSQVLGRLVSLVLLTACERDDPMQRIKESCQREFGAQGQRAVDNCVRWSVAPSLSR